MRAAVRLPERPGPLWSVAAKQRAGFFRVRAEASGNVVSGEADTPAKRACQGQSCRALTIRQTAGRAPAGKKEWPEWRVHFAPTRRGLVCLFPEKRRIGGKQGECPVSGEGETGCETAVRIKVTGFKMNASHFLINRFAAGRIAAGERRKGRGKRKGRGSEKGGGAVKNRQDCPVLSGRMAVGAGTGSARRERRPVPEAVLPGWGRGGEGTGSPFPFFGRKAAGWAVRVYGNGRPACF
ncbi:hypothetical protein OFAG_01009 [Oxalobacter formigenes HOxBLS]|uniref:Uncharacterized protein n=1 Tax=Oxalobacter paraformigenes TaxID=556268 RepID=C3X3S0_9BURK|nr:hypothetical protein OFAG_01009 [Oxalobacter paraformigenes]